jgi:hypothetical protein
VITHGLFVASAAAMIPSAAAIASPLNYAPLVPKDRRLIITGLGDRVAPPEQAELLWKHWDRCAFPPASPVRGFGSHDGFDDRNLGRRRRLAVQRLK